MQNLNVNKQENRLCLILLICRLAGKWHSPTNFLSQFQLNANFHVQEQSANITLQYQCLTFAPHRPTDVILWWNHAARFDSCVQIIEWRFRSEIRYSLKTIWNNNIGHSGNHSPMVFSRDSNIRDIRWRIISLVTKIINHVQPYIIDTLCMWNCVIENDIEIQPTMDIKSLCRYWNMVMNQWHAVFV